MRFLRATGMPGYPNLHDLPGLVAHHEEDVQRLEEDRANREEVARPDVLRLARQELPPAGRRDAAIRSAPVRGDGPSRHDEPQPCELCLDAALSSEGVLRGHPPDESPQLPRDAGSPAARSPSGPPAPVGRPPPAMPAEHGGGLDHEEALAPSGHPPTGENPEPAVPIAQPRRWPPPLQHNQLLTQAQILGDQVRSGREPCRDRPPRPPDHAEPPSVLDPDGSLARARTEGKVGSSSCALQLP